MPSTPAMFCRVCSQPLDTYEARGPHDELLEVSFRHAAWVEADHEPEPEMILDPDKVAARCDFCMAEVTDGGWTYPCTDFEVLVVFGPDQPTTHASAGDWCACDDCHADLAAGRLDAIVVRALDHQAVPPRARDTAERFMRNLWVGFAAHRSGPPYKEADRARQWAELEAVGRELQRLRQAREAAGPAPEENRSTSDDNPESI